MLCPFTAVYDGISMTEPLSIFAVALGIYAADRAIAAEASGTPHSVRLIFAGCAAGLGMFSGPMESSCFLPSHSGSFCYFVLRSRLLPTARLRTSAAASLSHPSFRSSACCPWLPWTIRNWGTLPRLPAARPALCRSRRAVDRRRAPLAPHLDHRIRRHCQRLLELSRRYHRPRRHSTARLRHAATAPANARPYCPVQPNRNAAAWLDARFAALAEQRIHDHPFRFYVTLPRPARRRHAPPAPHARVRPRCLLVALE